MLVEGLNAKMVAFLQIDLVCFVITYHFEILQFHLLSSCNSLLEPLGYCDQDLLLWLLWGVLVSHNDLNPRILRQNGQDLLNLSDQLSRVCNDYYLYCFYRWVHLHYRWNAKC